jgi:hypothetical protein
MIEEALFPEDSFQSAQLGFGTRRFDRSGLVRKLLQFSYFFAHIKMRMFDFARPELRVLANSDSDCRGFRA